MKSEKISDAIGNVEEELIQETEQVRRKRKRPLWIAWVAAAVCVCVALGAMVPLMQREGAGGGARPQGIGIRLAAPTYPVMHPYPPEDLLMSDPEAYIEEITARNEDLQKQRDYGESVNQNALQGFVQRSAKELLIGTDGQNCVYSPANIYMALAMLAETTDNSSRAQILQVLGMESIEELRTQAEALWNANYCNDGTTISILANSFWLREGASYDKATLNRLAENYYASAFSGKTGTEEYDQLLREWINEQTGGLLENQTKELKLSADALIALVSTIYFKSAWADEFSESRTEPDTFHAPEGDVTVDFMHSVESVYYWGEKYGAVKRDMMNGSAMWLILPDEASSVDEVLADGEALDMAANKHWDNEKWMQVNLSLPKFDISSDLDLKEGLQALGVTDVFDESTADFSPLTDHPEVSLRQATHAARVSIDEKGCEAAAYTILVAADGAMPVEDEIDFVLDRPFLFVITGSANQILFVGTVYQP